ncbi:MAG: BatA (Bacteroides aerotolerance operon) [uncultured Campylobacterales bacterium]|uniref:BatA (Bacteroides aerotolerance operon) n=1 Tax=uncultured Campylobacterales bacterium TaxID=352960 RepID=A0A6S6S7B0_9BACT|nr:MAG: BatA (Bacteroides aerotolerance operon) [uncultured Campylobacterales bacterium]
MQNLSFEYPYAFLILIVFVICDFFFKKQLSLLYFPFLQTSQLKKSKKNIFKIIFKYLSIIALVTALASPITKTEISNIKKDGYAISLLIDASGSMQRPISRVQSRFDVSKEILIEFIKNRLNDKIALVVFGGYSYIASPLSYDKVSLSDIASRMTPGIAGENTSIYDGLFTSIKTLKNSKAKSKMIILLTDGRNTVTSVPQNVIIKLAKKYNIKIYTVGISDEVDVSILKNIAFSTGGKFFLAQNKTQLKNIYETIDKLEKSEIEQNKYSLTKYYYQYPLGLSFLSIVSSLFF